MASNEYYLGGLLESVKNRLFEGFGLGVSLSGHWKVNPGYHVNTHQMEIPRTVGAGTRKLNI